MRCPNYHFDIPPCDFSLLTCVVSQSFGFVLLKKKKKSLIHLYFKEAFKLPGQALTSELGQTSVKLLWVGLAAHCPSFCPPSQRLLHSAQLAAANTCPIVDHSTHSSRTWEGLRWRDTLFHQLALQGNRMDSNHLKPLQCSRKDSKGCSTEGSGEAMADEFK